MNISNFCTYIVMIEMLSTCLCAKAQNRKENIKQSRRIMRHAIDSLADIRHNSANRKERVNADMGVVRKMTDNLLDIFQKTKTDTNFVSRPDKPLTVKLKNDVSGNMIRINTVSAEGNKVDYLLSNNLRETVGITANYRGLSATLSINPKKLMGKTSDKEYIINYYNNKYGIDLSYGDIHNFYGGAPHANRSNQVRYDEARLRNLQTNVYYVFNNRKFSYPAVFTNSYIQRKSSGSIIAAASLYSGKLSGMDRISEDMSSTLTLSDITMMHASLGAGYAYNYVPNKRWLFHLSTQISVLLKKRYTLSYTDMDGERHDERMKSKFANIFNVGRVGMTYFKNDLFFSLTSVVQLSNVGDTDQYSITNVKWKARLSAGKRF
ncbi:MAG: DUF4421 domain-containing protein [Bacteroidaceae bacterium]|nr:DUF4421 domain-containing protein [Bacteroidaceae bacterium]